MIYRMKMHGVGYYIAVRETDETYATETSYHQLPE